MIGYGIKLNPKPGTKTPSADLSGAVIRARAAQCLDNIHRHGKTLDQSLLSAGVSHPLLSELVFGSLRFHFSLSELIDHHLSKAFRKKDYDIYALLVVGAYQLTHLDLPDHAVLDQTVGACKPLGKPWAKALVNGVLRSLQRRGAIEPHSKEAIYDHPQWFIDNLTEAYGSAAPNILHTNNTRAPMSLRVNVVKATSSEVQRRLTEAKIAFSPGLLPETLILQQPLSTAELPGYQNGTVAVQDAGGQLINRLLPKGHRLLDACAAPGGKCFHLLEQRPNIEIHAIDNKEARLEAMKQQSERLGHHDNPHLKLYLGDATTLDWWDGRPFDGVLIDAPCSGSGTLRRHPDIKHLRKIEQLREYVALQTQLLANLWQTLRPGGSLLYCTCSIFTQENDAVIAAFCKQQQQQGEHEPVQPQAIELPTGRATEFGWQLLPTDPTTDGFYFARLDKAA